VLVVLKLVEAGARRREKHDVPGREACEAISTARWMFPRARSPRFRDLLFNFLGSAPISSARIAFSRNGFCNAV